MHHLNREAGASSMILLFVASLIAILLLCLYGAQRFYINGAIAAGKSAIDATARGIYPQVVDYTALQTGGVIGLNPALDPETLKTIFTTEMVSNLPPGITEVEVVEVGFGSSLGFIAWPPSEPAPTVPTFHVKLKAKVISPIGGNDEDGPFWLGLHDDIPLYLR
jgi:hypothetical protein